MNRPPRYLELIEPGVPRWRRWGLALMLLWGVLVSVLTVLWPEGQPKLDLWLWSIVLPICWTLALALRVLAWQLGLFNREVYHRTLDATVQRWWARRQMGLPVEQTLLIGPAGDVQTQYQNLMADTPIPQPCEPTPTTQAMLRCPVLLSSTTERGPALARRLARLFLSLPEIVERWPRLRGIAWVGDASSQAAFETALTKAGVPLPETRLALQGLTDLDHLIDAFHQDCPDLDDWLLCAGAASTQAAEGAVPPGEAGFLWLVCRQGGQLLHRGEYLLSENHEAPADLCAQVQRLANLDCAPPTCLALDKASQDAFLAGGWSAAGHQLSGHWGALGLMSPFIGMSLAMLQAGESGQACGWLSQDGNNQLAIGMAVPNGNG